jgi:cell division protein FtsB
MNDKIKKIDFDIYTCKNLIWHISQKDNQTDQDKKDIKMLKKDIKMLKRRIRSLKKQKKID